MVDEVSAFAPFRIWVLSAVVGCALGCGGHSDSNGNAGPGGAAGQIAGGGGGANGGGHGGSSGAAGSGGRGGQPTCPGDTEPGCPPVVDAGADRTVSCGASEGATFELSGSALDRDGIEAVAWTREGETLGTSLTLEVTAPLGESEFVLTATDITGDVAADTVIVTVADTEPPALAANDVALLLCECSSFTPPAPDMIDCRPDALTATNPVAIGSTREAPRFDAPEPFPLIVCPGDTLLVLWTLSDGEHTTEIDQLAVTHGPSTPAEQEACE